jgi:hypothetical protein
LEEVGPKVAGADAAAGSDHELCDAAAGLARHVSVALVGLAHVPAELDTRGVAAVVHREGGQAVGVRDAP